MHEIEADIHLSPEDDVWAYGMVTLDHCIKFPIQMRRYKNKESGEEKSFLSFPRREGKNGWEDIVHPDQELREEIMDAVDEAIKKELMKDINLPEIDNVEVTPVNARYSNNAKAKICGLATIQVSGLTIRGITIKQGERGMFVNMPQYKNGTGVYKDIAYGTSKAMQEKITQAVLDMYSEAVKRKGQEMQEAKEVSYGKSI